MPWTWRSVLCLCRLRSGHTAVSKNALSVPIYMGPAHLRYGARTADVPLRRGQRYRLVADGGFPGGR